VCQPYDYYAKQLDSVGPWGVAVAVFVCVGTPHHCLALLYVADIHSPPLLVRVFRG